MTIPTRFIDKDEFNRLMKSEGPMIMLYKLDAVTFQPPRPNQKWSGEKKVSINILLLNVIEPVIYKDEQGMTFIILNKWDDENVFTYQSFQDCHIIKGAWYYRLVPAWWSATDWSYDLDDAIVRYQPEEVAA